VLQPSLQEGYDKCRPKREKRRDKSIAFKVNEEGKLAKELAKRVHLLAWRYW
jgi:hypothetical protein